jgi:Flp pilus assembly pilin Flp
MTLEHINTRVNHRLARPFAAFYAGEEGQAIVEYALVLVLVSIAAITLLSAIGVFPSSIFSEINADF